MSLQDWVYSLVLPYKLEYFGTGSTAIDISEYVEEINKFTDVGTGEIVSAKVMLDARFGDFITESNSNSTPIIKQYDLFRLTITDDDDNTYWRYLIQDDISPQRNDYNDHIVLELLARERYLQKMYFPGHFYFISFRDMVIKIRDFYNTNRGSSQPQIRAAATDLNDFPPHTYGIFEFGDNTTVYDALMEVVNRLSLSVAAGGAGQYFGLLFNDSASATTMLMRIQAQGSTPTNPITLENAVTLTEVKQPLQGNIVVVEGQKGTGSFPKEPALWRSLVEEFDNLPLWDDTVTYQKDSYVRYNDAIYQAKNNHSTSNITPTVTASWDAVNFVDYVVDYTGDSNFQYSPYTNDKQAVWRNWGGNAGANSGNSFLADAVPTGQDVFDSLCFTDSNLVIRDANAWRDWVDFRVASLSDVPSAYLYDSTTDNSTVQQRTYHGMRVLVDPAKGTIASPFTGNDKFGNAYSNALVMQDQDGDWVVFRNAEQFDECVVCTEGRIFEYNTPLGIGGASNSRALRGRTTASNNLAWRDTSAVLMGNDSFHYPSTFENTDGLIGEDTNSIVTLDNGTNSEFTDDSAIKIEYEFGETDVVASILQKSIPLTSIIGETVKFLTDDSTPVLKTYTTSEENKLYSVDIYNIGWWCTLWETPFPKSTNNGISESVGDLFGGDADNKRPILDLYNLNQTPSGTTGYGNADSSALGPLDGFKLLYNFDITGIDLDALRGDIPFRAVIYDLLGNVWISDVKYRFQGDTQELDFPFSSFRIYRSRIQPGFTLSNAISRIINPELRITEIFERRLVKRINLHCLLSHDDQGRYDPLNWEAFIRKFLTFITATNVKYTGIVDAFHFTKTPIAIASDGVDDTNSIAHRHLMMPIKKYPKISNVVQLQKIANSELDIAKHQNDLWTAKFENRADICAEDTLYLKDVNFISETDKTNDPNTRQLIVKKTTYSIGDKNTNSGIIATVELFRQVAT